MYSREGSYPSGEHNVIYKLVKSLCPTHENNITLYVDYTRAKSKNQKNVKKQDRDVETG